jgi:LuxR family maltose regulon positive regulatory protein
VAPAPPPGAICREGILHRSASNSAVNLVVLQAPAGHGKSTALQQLKEVADAQGHLTGWLTFDAGDNDPRRFFMHFQSLLNRTAGLPADGVEQQRLVNFHNRSDWLLEQLARVGRPIVLFLDEFQTLTDKAVLAFFRSLFERAPPSLRVFLGSRSLPDVGLARLVVNNRALILHGDDLRFSPLEVQRFFDAAGDLGIDIDEVDAIYRRTEGWPAALQLFRLTLGSPHIRKSLGNHNARAPRELAEYLAENVLALQPARLQEFLLCTAELTRLSGPLCDEVLGWNDSREILQQLERSGMFLRCIDPQGGWYKYHTLFSSILAELRRAHGSVESGHQIHRRAAQWYMQHQFFEETVHHASVCGDFPLAADALNQWSSGLVAGAHLRTIEYWSERLPFAEIASRPELAIKCTYALVFLRRRQRAKPLLELLKQRSGSGTVLNTTDPNVVLSIEAISSDDIARAFSISAHVPLQQLNAEGFAAFELGAAANLRGYCALAAQEFESAREYLALARVHNDHVNAAFSRGYTIAVSGVAALIQGSLSESLERFKEGLSEHPVIDKSFASAALLSCYVWALYEANQLEKAESLFLQNHDIISDSTLPDFLTVAYISNARVHDARGRMAKAEAVLEEAEAIGRDSGWLRLVETVKWERVRRALLHGSVDQAQSIAARPVAENPLPANWIPFASDVEDSELSGIRLALAVSELPDARRRIDSAMKRQRGRVLRQIKLQLLASVLAARTDNQTELRRSLSSALRLARQGGFVRAVLDEGDEVLQLIREKYQSLLESELNARRPDSGRDFIETLLQASGTDLSRKTGLLNVALQPLTEREREMLVLLANGISNKDMANRLFVSENTVKFHLKNIYAKLSVVSRVQAITAARQIGIIH